MSTSSSNVGLGKYGTAGNQLSGAAPDQNHFFFTNANDFCGCIRDIQQQCECGEVGNVNADMTL
ncbi:hypothetical protein HDU98_004521 [Podochytrium sp. JEL0797]|nr:hypothetical protein HDU98_004521 [Podochytrium sp. JEL0797]